MYKFWNYKKESKTFAERLKGLRIMKGMSQSELAKELCVSRSCISNYERGSRYPDYEMIKRIAEFFDVFIDYLTSTSDYYNLPLEKGKMQEYTEISNIIKSCGNKIDISGISMNKKIAIVEYAKYIINSDEGMFRNNNDLNESK